MSATNKHLNAAPTAGNEYTNFLANLKTRIHEARVRAALSVNRELVLLYPAIPKQYGGGKPTLAYFVLNENHRSAAEGVGLEFYSDKSVVSKPISLLFETGQDFVFKNSDSHTVRLKRNCVDAIVIVR